MSLPPYDPAKALEEDLEPVEALRARRVGEIGKSGPRGLKFTIVDRNSRSPEAMELHLEKIQVRFLEAK
jgi:hypothetical protein